METQYKNYPLFFSDGTCVACGAKDSVKEINKFGYQSDSKKDLYSTSFMKCSKCNEEFFIRWDEDDDGEFNVPIATSFNDIDLYVRVIANDLKSSLSQSD